MITFQDNTKLSFDEWLLLRNNSIGASEVGVVCFGGKYKSNVELFYEKVGYPKDEFENLRMLIGRETEELSAKLWSYYEGSDESVLKNMKSGTPVKVCLDLKVTAFNSKFPQLSATVDREIQPMGKYIGMGKGALEIKNTQSFILNTYESKLPIENVVQLCTQMLVNDYKYGELFYFIDNKTCECHEILRADVVNIEEIIIERTAGFWDGVLKAKPIYNQLVEAKRNFNQRLVAECEREISMLEPPPQYNAAYSEFLSKKYKDRLGSAGILQGTDEIYDCALKLKSIDASIKELSTEKMKCEVLIKEFLGDSNTIEFSKKGSITWKESSSGRRILINKTK